MRLDKRLQEKLGGHREKGSQTNARVLGRGEERYACLGAGVGALERAEGCAHQHDCLEVHLDPDNAPIRSSPVVRSEVRHPWCPEGRLWEVN